eukprot:COSAG01_NODE_9708_length_2364_cov_3.562914_3_plen_72_part_00
METWNRSILAAICLCHAWSDREIEGGNGTPGAHHLHWLLHDRYCDRPTGTDDQGKPRLQINPGAASVVSFY